MNKETNSTSGDDKETSTSSEEEEDENHKVKSKGRNERGNTKENICENIQKPPFPVYDGEIRMRKAYVTNLL